VIEVRDRCWLKLADSKERWVAPAFNPAVATPEQCGNKFGSISAYEDTLVTPAGPTCAVACQSFWTYDAPEESSTRAYRVREGEIVRIDKVSTAGAWQIKKKGWIQIQLPKGVGTSRSHKDPEGPKVVWAPLYSDLKESDPLKGPGNRCNLREAGRDHYEVVEKPPPAPTLEDRMREEAKKRVLKLKRELQNEELTEEKKAKLQRELSHATMKASPPIPSTVPGKVIPLCFISQF